MKQIPEVHKPPCKRDEVMAKKWLTRDELQQNITHDHTYSLLIEEAPVVVDPSCLSHIGLDKEIQLTEQSTMLPDTPIIDTSRFCIEMFTDGDQGIRFYTSFQTYNHLIICYNFLGDAVNCPGSTSSCSRIKTQQNEVFLTLCRLRCGLLEQDLAYRFNISQSTVPRIFTAWINFLHHKFREIPIWPSQDQVRKTIPEQFKHQYPSQHTYYHQCNRIVYSTTFRSQCTAANIFIVQKS